MLYDKDAKPLILDPIIERAKEAVDAREFKNWGDYEKALGQKTDELRLQTAQTEATRREADKAERNGLDDTRRRLESIGIDNPSDEMVRENYEKDKWERDCWAHQ